MNFETKAGIDMPALTVGVNHQLLSLIDYMACLHNNGLNKVCY